MSHISVLLKESIDNLNIKAGDIIVDGTLGGGGHSKEIVKRFGNKVKIIAIDLDKDSVLRTKKNLEGYKYDIIFETNNFENIEQILEKLKIPKIDKVILDLGLSSFQLDVSERGFSFLKDEPLLMTMKKNPNKEDLTAIDVVNDWGEESLADIIYGFGEEKYARVIAKAIVLARVEKRIETTKQLVEIIDQAVGKMYKRLKIHPATRTFQALRITVNKELMNLGEGILKIFSFLNKDGQIAIISFHSLEDRIVKKIFRQIVNEEKGILINKKPISPSEEELQINRKARSAKLRIIKKI